MFVNVLDNAGFDTHDYHRTIIEAELYYFIIQSEHGCMLGPHPLGHINSSIQGSKS